MSRLSDTKGDDWKGLANDYERLTKETANRPIEAMLTRANALLPFAQATGILDNGCGPGPVGLQCPLVSSGIDHNADYIALLTDHGATSPRLRRAGDVFAYVLGF